MPQKDYPAILLGQRASIVLQANKRSHTLNAWDLEEELLGRMADNQQLCRHCFAGNACECSVFVCPRSGQKSKAKSGCRILYVVTFFRKGICFFLTIRYLLNFCRPCALLRAWPERAVNKDAHSSKQTQSKDPGRHPHRRHPFFHPLLLSFIFYHTQSVRVNILCARI